MSRSAPASPAPSRRRRLVRGELEALAAVGHVHHHAVGVARHGEQRPLAAGVVHGVAHGLAARQREVEELVGRELHTAQHFRQAGTGI